MKIVAIGPNRRCGYRATLSSNINNARVVSGYYCNRPRGYYLVNHHQIPIIQVSAMRWIHNILINNVNYCAYPIQPTAHAHELMDPENKFKRIDGEK